jgi:hypothetical protein
VPRKKTSPTRQCTGCGRIKHAIKGYRKGATVCVACEDRPKAEDPRIDPAIQAELASRELARRHFRWFVPRMKPQYLFGWVHVDIAYRLQRFMEAVERKESPWLLLMMPPRHGKSEQVSRQFPAYVFGRHPEWEIIHTSYAVSLPEEFSREIRENLRTTEYQALFPNTKLHAEFQSIDAWRLAQFGGGYTAAGVGGGIIGKGAHVFVIDDPVKNVEEAESQIIRDATWKWLTSVASTRLAPGGGVLIIMQCWHEDDVAGRVQEVLAQEGGFNLEVVSYPALAEEDEWLDRPAHDHLLEVAQEVREDKLLTRYAGEALHEARYTAKYLNSQKFLLTDREWSALYQQKPIPDGGLMFRPEQFRLSEPPNTAFYEPVVLQAWDFAISINTQANWTVGVCGLLHPGDILEIVDLRRFRSDDDQEIAAEICGLAQAWFSPTITTGVENGQIWKAIKRDVERAAQEMPRAFTLVELNPLTDKKARAKPLQARFQRGRITFRQGLALYEQARRELLRFPGSKDDDCVDALAWLAQLALTVTPPVLSGIQRRRPPKSWRDELATQQRRGVALSHLSA